jgi:hypothetical protein
MQEHKIYFELFGKKMKTTILARSKDAAIEILKNKIIIHSVLVSNPPSDDDIVDQLGNMFGFK